MPFLTQVENSKEETPSAEEICEQAKVSYDEADQECDRLSQETKLGGDTFHHESCIMDYCGSGGQKQIVDEEIEAEGVFEAEDAADDAAQS